MKSLRPQVPVFMKYPPTLFSAHTATKGIDALKARQINVFMEGKRLEMSHLNQSVLCYVSMQS